MSISLKFLFEYEVNMNVDPISFHVYKPLKSKHDLHSMSCIYECNANINERNNLKSLCHCECIMHCAIINVTMTILKTVSLRCFSIRLKVKSSDFIQI